jgi:hypothetical protein
MISNVFDFINNFILMIQTSVSVGFKNSEHLSCSMYRCSTMESWNFTYAQGRSLQVSKELWIFEVINGNKQRKSKFTVLQFLSQ